MAAPDFYFAINATFRHIYNTYGEEALIAYWEAMGQEYFHYLSEQFREGGLAAVEKYWREFFNQEPGGDVEVSRKADGVEVRVNRCPAIAHLRAHHREILPLYCRHCDHISRVIARNAGMGFSLEGGMGRCRQVFAARTGSKDA